VLSYWWRLPRNWRIFVLIQMCDVLSTVIGLSIGGGMFEGNPIMRMFLHPFGSVFMGLLVAKTLMCGGFALYAISWPKKVNFNFVNTGFGLVVLWNLVVISRHL